MATFKVGLCRVLRLTGGHRCGDGNLGDLKVPVYQENRYSGSVNPKSAFSTPFANLHSKQVHWLAVLTFCRLNITRCRSASNLTWRFCLSTIA